MDKMKKAQEMKAHNVANDIFDFHMDAEIFNNLSVEEKLGLLEDKIHTLKTQFKEKLFAQLIAKCLKWFIKDYTQEHQLCPECFIELSYKVTYRQTYWQPEEGELYCESCNWKVAV